MTEALISALAEIRSLRVMSRTSVISDSHTEEQVPKIARELSVDAVIEETVLLTAERVRISVHGNFGTKKPISDGVSDTDSD
jgi:TolB-like protein